MRKGGVQRGGPTPPPPGTAAAPTQPLPQPDPDLACCRQDMCNYRDIDVYIQVDGSYDSQTGESRRPDLTHASTRLGERGPGCQGCWLSVHDLVMTTV